MLKVLIADDSALLRERLARTLANVPGVELVGQMTNGRETLDAVQQLKPDVVILDIRMPKGNGLQVLKAIKVDNDAPMDGAPIDGAPVVIILTAYPHPQYQRICREAGAEFFFEKLSEFDRVPQVIANLALQSKPQPSGEKWRLTCRGMK